MKYQQPTFTLPTSSNKVTQEEWDRIFKPRNRRTSPRMKDLERAVDRATKKKECTVCHGKSFACEMCELIKEGKL